MTQVAPGLHWLRLPLPFALDHVNVYLFEEAEGWTLYDTGVNDEATRAIWLHVAERLAAKPFRRLIVSHYHPDHIGLAGWFGEHFGLPLHITRSEYETARRASAIPDDATSQSIADFYASAGLPEAQSDLVINHAGNYRNRISALPASYLPMSDGDTLDIAGQSWQVITGSGHTTDLAMLYCAEQRLLLTADQVIAKITPNLSAGPMNPNADHVGEYLGSMDKIRGCVPDDVLVLPAHNLPFTGLHARLDSMVAHHQKRLGLLQDACRETAQRAVDLIPVMFRRPIVNHHDLRFAIGEIVAHLNNLMRSGSLIRERREDAAYWYRAP